MATFISPMHRNNINHQKLSPGSEATNSNLSNSTLEMRTVSESSSESKANILVAFVFALEFLLLVFLVVLEYFLRFTEVFPVRHMTFSCNDPALSFSTQSSNTFEHFQYKAVIPFAVVISLSFCLPPVVIIIGEICLWAFSSSHQKTVRVLCHGCKVPQIFRRMIRYIGSFLFGLLLTMIVTDVIKLMTGRLRPSFIEICRPNVTLCSNSMFNDENVCTEKDLKIIREARLSFPSMHAAMTAYAAGFLAIYIHNIVRTHSVRLIRPFLAMAFILLSVMCCLQRYGLHYSHIEDVGCGFALGLVIAIYMGVFLLNNFRENITGQALYNRIKLFLGEYQYRELKSIKDEHYEYYNSYGGPVFFPPTNNYTMGIHIPRPHTRQSPNMNEQRHTTELNHIERNHMDQLGLDQAAAKRRQHNTFQRDLARTLQYRQTSDDESSIGQSHM